MKKGILILSLVLLLSCSFVYALTGSIGNARMILYPEVGFFGTTIEKSITVRNVNNESVNISLQVSDELKDVIELIDDSFILQPGEEKDAAFLIKLRKAGDYEGNINVFFTSLEGGKTGVALSSTIIILADGESNDNSDNSDNTNDDTIIDSNGTGITGNVVSDQNKISPVLIASLLTTLVLAVFLVWLIFMINKRKKKRADRSS